MNTKKTVYLLLPLMLSACAAVGPDYQRPPLNLPVSYSQQTAQDQAALQAQPRWWEQFGDNCLNRLIDTAWQQNPDLQAAAARLRQARAVQQAQGAATSPTSNADARLSADRLSLNSENFANVPFKNPINNFTNRQIGFDASWELDFWGRQQRINQSAAARTAATALREDDLRLQLSAEVARNYIELRSAGFRLALAKQSLALLEQSLRLVQLQQRVGEASQLDVQRLQAARDSFAATVPALEQSRRQSLATLSVLTAMPVQELEIALKEAAAQLPAVPPAPAAGLPAELLRRRPDVMASESELAAASADIGVAVSDLYPRFALTGNAGWNSIRSDNLISQGSQTWSIGPQFSLPLLNRQRLNAQVEANRAAFDASAAAYKKAVLTAVADTEAALSRLSTAIDSEAQTTAASRQQQAQLTLLEKQRRAGDLSRLPLIDQERNLLAQQDMLLQARAQSLIALISLNKALGGGWQAAPDQNGR